ncbi:hypothetical protein MTR67_051342 [Solanum verrucosum]|uniref:Uncharacterized protein n=1 Tax=Solanum verrucosum TaxID=315347 RepID=A0AAF0V4P7_SOLVR|nr:hypothetical protein MTR67_051342 [Solanum verrucosum]
METNSLGQLQNRLQTLAITSHPLARANQPSGRVMHFTHHHSLKEYGSSNSEMQLVQLFFQEGIENRSKRDLDAENLNLHHEKM